MNGFIIDPEKESFEEIKLPAQEKLRLKKIAELLGTDGYMIAFIEPQEFTTCTAYMTAPDPRAPFFRVKGFVSKVKFAKTVVIDKTASGFPKNDGITVMDVKPMVTFFSGKRPSRKQNG